MSPAPDTLRGYELPAPFRAFLDLYGAGRYWDSHEALEDAWRARGSAFYQGLILYASAWVHWERGNAHGVRAQLRKARARLASYPDGYLGLDVAELRAHCDAAHELVVEDPEGWRTRITALPLRLAGACLRGDEMELRP